METSLFTNINTLVGIHDADLLLLRGADMAQLPSFKNAWLLVEDGRIDAFGSMDALPTNASQLKQISLNGAWVFPSWCDSHTHLVFAASREEEFVLKIQGKSYEEIALAGGGILNSAQKIQACSEDELFALAKQRLQKVMATGTGAIELKSGYGLSVEGEIKMLRVIKRLKEWSPIPIKATFLGAHAYPQEFKKNHQGYIDLLLKTLLPKIGAEGLADYIDVFCEQGFFSLAETEQILTAAAAYGLKPKIHANQLSASGAVELAVRHQALSVDHLEEMNAAAEDALANSNTIATLLPNCSLFLGIPFANARRLLAKNVCLALASDYNPGSAPSGNMNLVVSLACMRQKMLPEEAINAATLNGAAAMELSDMYGSLSVGKVANFFYTKALPSLAYLPYSFGENLIEGVFINGKRYENE
ncbi:MAG: imidazolonepropionase [Sphingobacteriaceae bacterium]|nr:imidazolonepropionase [Sphingobacteriaceae bacterium]